MTALEVTVLGEDGITATLALAGELDISSGPLFEQELRQLEKRSPSLLIVDLGELSFIDSTGLRLILEADARAREAGRRLALISGPEAVDRVFQVSGVGERLQVFRDRDEIGDAE